MRISIFCWEKQWPAWYGPFSHRVKPLPFRSSAASANSTVNIDPIFAISHPQLSIHQDGPGFRLRLGVGERDFPVDPKDGF